MGITGPGTVDDLLADAASQGHRITARMITDWVGLGLLDQPQRRPQGRGRGSAKGLFSANQRHLMLTLLSKRDEAHRRVDLLARIPIFLWLYHGDDYVPTRQTMRALGTWHGDGTSNKAQARQAATRMLELLDHSLATPIDRRALVDLLADIAWKGRIDDRPGLERAVRQVFEPPSVYGPIVRTVGDPATGVFITADGALGLIDARWAASQAITGKTISAADLTAARERHLTSRLGDYAAQRHRIQAGMPQPYAALFAPDAPQTLFDQCALDLATMLGLMILERRRTGGLNR